MTTNLTTQTTLTHRVDAFTAAAVRAIAQAAAPVIADAVRAAAPSRQAAIRRLAEALVEADERSPARRQQPALEDLRASGKAARRDLLVRPRPSMHR